MIVARERTRHVDRELRRFLHFRDRKSQAHRQVTTEQETMLRPTRLRVGDDEDVGVLADTLDIFFVTADPDLLMKFLQQWMLFASPYVTRDRVQRTHRQTPLMLCAG